MHQDLPDCIVGARRGSPLVLGIGKDENFLASDVSAIVAHTRDAVYLNDYDIAASDRDEFEITSLLGGTSGYEVSKVEFSEKDVDKGDYPHYMLKEIFEQPETVHDAMRGRLSREEATAKLGGLEMTAAELREVERIIFTRLRHGVPRRDGRRIPDRIAGAHADGVEFASEFRYRNMPMTKDTLVFVISQSGETADTLAALRESQRKGPPHARHLQQRRQHDRARKRRRRLHARRARRSAWRRRNRSPRRSTILTLLGLLLGRIRHLSTAKGCGSSTNSRRCRTRSTQILKQNDHIKAIADKYCGRARR